jgi:hypothetical protein
MKKQGLLILVIVGLFLLLVFSMSYRLRGVKSIGDMETQLTKQFRNQLPRDVHSVDVVQFKEPPAEGAMLIIIRIRWDEQNSKLAGLTLHPLADKYYVGTFRLEDNPELGRVNVMLHFP